MKVFIFLYIFTGAVTANQPTKVLVESAVSLLNEGLKIYPKIELHLQLSAHKDLTRIQEWMRESVPNDVEDFLKEAISRCENVSILKRATLESMARLTRNENSTNGENVKSFQKRNMMKLIESMLKEMAEGGTGSIDFELDDVGRTGLGDVYFYVKTKISSYVMGGLKDCPEDCEFSHPLVVKTLSALRSLSEEVLRKLLVILLGVPGLETKLIRPQLVHFKPKLTNVDDETFQFLVSVGEWTNDVLNSGLITIQNPFGEIRGHLVEVLGDSKDEVVPKIETILNGLESQDNSDRLIMDAFITVVQKYFGQF